MHFLDSAGRSQELRTAIRHGCPSQGLYYPESDCDLRHLIYAPEPNLAEAFAASLSSLCPDLLDPSQIYEISETLFPTKLHIHVESDDLHIIDFCQYGANRRPSAENCGADFLQASFLALVLGKIMRAQSTTICEGLDLNGSESFSQAWCEAIEGRPHPHILLYPAEYEVAPDLIARRNRGRGPLFIAGLRGGTLEDCVQMAKSMARTGLTWIGPASPLRLLFRIALIVSSFALLRKNSSGDYIIALRAGEGLGLAAALWSWGYGLPLTTILLPFGPRGLLGPNGDVKDLLTWYDIKRPGILRSLLSIQLIDPAKAIRLAAELEKKGGPALDLATADAYLAARTYLNGGFAGHSRIVLSHDHISCEDKEGLHSSVAEEAAHQADAALLKVSGRNDLLAAEAVSTLQRALRFSKHHGAGGQAQQEIKADQFDIVFDEGEELLAALQNRGYINSDEARR